MSGHNTILKMYIIVIILGLLYAVLKHTFANTIIFMALAIQIFTTKYENTHTVQ